MWPLAAPRVSDARLCKNSAGERHAAIDYWLEMGQLVTSDVRVGETDRQQ